MYIKSVIVLLVIISKIVKKFTCILHNICDLY